MVCNKYALLLVLIGLISVGNTAPAKDGLEAGTATTPEVTTPAVTTPAVTTPVVTTPAGTTGTGTTVPVVTTVTGPAPTTAAGASNLGSGMFFAMSCAVLLLVL